MGERGQSIGWGAITGKKLQGRRSADPPPPQYFGEVHEAGGRRRKTGLAAAQPTQSRSPNHIKIHERRNMPVAVPVLSRRMDRIGLHAKKRTATSRNRGWMPGWARCRATPCTARRRRHCEVGDVAVHDFRRVMGSSTTTSPNRGAMRLGPSSFAITSAAPRPGRNSDTRSA